MKNKPFPIVFLFLVAALCVSCEKEIEFNGGQTDPKLVLNGVCTVGEPVTAQVSKSYFFLDSDGDTEAPEGTTAHLYVNGDYCGEMTLYEDTIPSAAQRSSAFSSKGKSYRNEYCPKAGDRISIMASAPGFDAVEATAGPMPEAASCVVRDFILHEGSSFDTTWHDADSSISFHMAYMADVILEIADNNPGQTDYFVLNCSVDWLGEEWDSDIWVTYDDPIFGNENLVIGELFEGLDRKNTFTDVLFDGKSRIVKLPVTLDLFGYSDPYSAQPVFSVRLEHLTKEYYDYMVTLSQQDQVLEFFAEPVHVFSNVKDGYGIVGGRNITQEQFPLLLTQRKSD